MKNIVILPMQVMFLILFILSLSPVFPQNLKNITIGEKYAGSKSVETTVGGYSGTLTIGAMNDGTVYSFHFISRNVINSRAEMPLFISDADNFLKNINRDFKITLDCKYWKHREFTKGNLYDVATCSKDGTSFLVSFSVNLYENFSTILFTVTNEELSKKGANEHLINNRRDF